mmetsp:Transcript_22119/g.27214  ORF Transcript_22119/g.27214 Transcript_22119/m.27214 type:complete len:127 (+) Transcript_22119:950-1330(+)
MISRTRYSFWKALGDVGGFHDGLIFLVRLIMAPYSAALFFADLLKDRSFSKKSAPKDKRSRARFAKFINSDQGRAQQTLEPDQVGFLTQSIRSLHKVKEGLLLNLKESVFGRKSRRRLAKEKLISK